MYLIQSMWWLFFILPFIVIKKYIFILNFVLYLLYIVLVQLKSTALNYITSKMGRFSSKRKGKKSFRYHSHKNGNYVKINLSLQGQYKILKHATEADKLNNQSVVDLTQNISCNPKEKPKYIGITYADCLKKFNYQRSKFQWKNNSCYLDATLGAMFSFSNTFDELLFSIDNNTSHFNKKMKEILYNDIIVPIRVDGFRLADTAKFRRAFCEINTRILGSMMDAEEFLHDLFIATNAKKCIQYTNGFEAYIHQLLSVKNPLLQKLIPLDNLLDESLSETDPTHPHLKFNQLPSPAFIVQLPHNESIQRVNKIIVPNVKLNLSRLLNRESKEQNSGSKHYTSVSMDDSDSAGITNGYTKKSGFWTLYQLPYILFHCLKKCYNWVIETNRSLFYAAISLLKWFSNKICPTFIRNYWNYFCRPRLPRSNQIPYYGSFLNSHPSTTFNTQKQGSYYLSSIICVSNSHYTCFVKNTKVSTAEWFYMDSMKGEILKIEDLESCLDKLHNRSQTHHSNFFKGIPSIIEFLVLNCHLCIYAQETDIVDKK